MAPIEIGELVAVAGVLFAASTWLAGRNGSYTRLGSTVQRIDDATSSTREDMRDVKLDLREMDRKLDGLAERTTSLEATVRAHEDRIARLEGRDAPR